MPLQCFDKMAEQVGVKRQALKAEMVKFPIGKTNLNNATVVLQFYLAFQYEIF
jgi:hypothetical protein